MKTEKSENKSNMFKVRMSDDDIKRFEKIAKIFKGVRFTNSQDFD